MAKEKLQSFGGRLGGRHRRGQGELTVRQQDCVNAVRWWVATSGTGRGPTVQEVAHSLGIDKVSASRLCRRLIDAGWLGVDWVGACKLLKPLRIVGIAEKPKTLSERLAEIEGGSK